MQQKALNCLQGLANMPAGAPFQEFQENQAFQWIQVFQETETHFKSVSRDSKSYQELSRVSIVSRAGFKSD